MSFNSLTFSGDGSSVSLGFVLGAAFSVRASNEQALAWTAKVGTNHGVTKDSTPIPVPATVTAYYAGTDVIAAGWTSFPSGTLASCIDEGSFDDADYIISPDLGTPSTYSWAPAPLAAGTYDIPFRGNKDNTLGQIRIVLLDSGGAVLATGAWHAQTGAFSTYTDNLTIAATSTQFRIETQ